MLRKLANNITKDALRLITEGKKKPGRPKNAWQRILEKEMRDQSLTLEEQQKCAQDVPGRGLPFVFD